MECLLKGSGMTRKAGRIANPLTLPKKRKRGMAMKL
jgi:hypothetical protein